MEPFQNIALKYKCPKALDELLPCQSNWYCDGCRKMVFDFRGMTEAQILDAFKQSGQNLCGVYDAGSIRVLPQKSKWYRWASAALLLLGLAGCQKPAELGKALVKPEIKEQPAVREHYFVGMPAITVNPMFPGGIVGWVKYVIQHLKYNGEYSGKVSVKFTVDRDGSLIDIRVIGGNNTALNTQI